MDIQRTRCILFLSTTPLWDPQRPPTGPVCSAWLLGSEPVGTWLRATERLALPFGGALYFFFFFHGTTRWIVRASYLSFCFYFYLFFVRLYVPVQSTVVVIYYNFFPYTSRTHWFYFLMYYDSFWSTNPNPQPIIIFIIFFVFVSIFPFWSVYYINSKTAILPRKRV